MRRIITSLLLVVFCSLAGINTGYSQKKVLFNTGDALHTDWSYTISPELNSLKKGDQFTVTFKAHVKEEGWHLYSSQEAPAGMGYNATKVDFYPKESCGFEKTGEMIEQSKPFVVWDDIMRDSVRFFKEHDVSFKQSFRLTEENATLTSELSYQICINPEAEDGGMCVFLGLPFEITTPGFKCGDSKSTTPDTQDTGSTATPISPTDVNDSG